MNRDQKAAVIEQIAADISASQAIFAIGEPGDQNKWNQTGRGIVLELAAEFVAGLSRHDHIGKNQVKLHLFQP